jgi:hypothetical protein
MAALGIPSYRADSGFCAIVMPPAPLDVTDAERAVRRRSRQNDPDGMVLHRLRQAPQEEVDGVVLGAIARTRHQVQPAVGDAHLDVRRNDVQVIALDAHTLDRLHDFEVGARGKQDRQRALVLRERGAARGPWQSPGREEGTGAAV